MCTLRIQGAEFDAEAWLARDARLEPCAVYWPGVPAYDKRVERGRTAVPGFNVIVSSRAWSDWDGQIEDAIAFLEAHHEVLGELSGREDVDSVTLDFPTDGKPDANVVVADRVLPVPLVQAAARAGVELELTVYVAASEGDAAAN